MAHLREVAHAAQDAVRNPRRAASAAADLTAASVVDGHAQDARGAVHDPLDLVRLVVVESVGDPEPVAKRCRQKPRARGGADQRERCQVEPQRVGARPLSDHDVDAPVLHRRVEQLLDRAVQAMDLVDEEHVVRLERGQDRGHVGLAVDRGARHDAQRRAHLVGDDAGQRGLAQAGRAGQQHVLAGLVSGARGG